MNLLVGVAVALVTFQSAGVLAFQGVSHQPLFRKNSAASKRAATSSLDDSTTTTSAATTIVVECPILGPLKRIRQEDDEDDTSFLGAMAVPTFACDDESDGDTDRRLPIIHEAPTSKLRPRGLEGVLCVGPAFVVDNVFFQQTCDALIETCEEALKFGLYKAGKNHHGALQIVVSQQTCDCVGQALAPFVNVDDVLHNMRSSKEASSVHTEDTIRLTYAGLNRRWRIYRYAPGGQETFAPHIDAGFPPSGLSNDGNTLLWDASDDNEVVSRLTVLMYLNDDFVGGETNFYRPLNEERADISEAPPVIASIKPRAGSILVFPQAVGEEAVEYARQHWPLHEGAPVIRGTRPKYVIRSDILFATQRGDEALMQVQDKLFRYDHDVRETFLPRSFVYHQNFLNHVSSLYNPHMGVENLGPLLYSFLRFTKLKRIVEIGAGYTSLWILQALKDNDEEMERIRHLQDEGKCRLLDWPWTVSSVVSDYKQTTNTASLLCIDNCLHQKETATGAASIAKQLGLEQYMEFLRQDAFELDLPPESIDVLWCDFGVGSRMKEFVSKAWSAIRPGGFLLCHSTLTNENTRTWLEAARSRKGEDETGMPPDEYVELSLLEPHKHYQNSISIFQKRKGADGMSFKEPLYSKFA